MKKCTKCGEIKELTEFYFDGGKPDGLKYACKACMKSVANKNYVPVVKEDSYTAENIKILDDKDILESMPWAMVSFLAIQFKKPYNFIARGIESCQLAGVGYNYFVDRYLKGDKSIPVDESVAYQNKILQGKEYNNSWARGDL